MIPKLSDFGFDKRWFLDFDNYNDFYIYEIGTYKCTPCYGYGPSIRPRDIIHFVISGKGKLYLNDNCYEIHAGQAFLIPAHVKSYYEADADEPWHYMWIHVGGARLSEIFYLAGLGADQPVFTPTEQSTFIEDTLKDIFRMHEDELYCIGKVYELFSFITGKSKTKVTKEVSPQLEYVQKTIKYIQLKYSEPLRVDEISNACGLNRSYLSRLFREATGISIQQYIITYRMKMAMNLITETNKSIQDISLAVGYSDIFTFSKAFKKYYSVPPSEYRVRSVGDSMVQ